jgi:hypothetical protein
MGEPVGIAVLRIWRAEGGGTRARLSTTIDVADPTETEVIYFTTSTDVRPAIVAWMERFEQASDFSNPGGHTGNNR